MQTSNNYELGVFNGDIGVVSEVHVEQKALSVRFDERVVRYEWSSLDELDYAWPAPSTSPRAASSPES